MMLIFHVVCHNIFQVVRDNTPLEMVSDSFVFGGWQTMAIILGQDVIYDKGVYLCSDQKFKTITIVILTEFFSLDNIRH